MMYADHFCKCEETFKDGVHEYVYTGPCVVSGKEITVTLPAEGLYKYRQGAFIQDAFPELSADEREFLMSGISGEEFDRVVEEREE